jgi:hypothetical protein
MRNSKESTRMLLLHAKRAGVSSTSYPACAGEKAWRINAANKSVYQRWFGTILARMTSMLFSIASANLRRGTMRLLPTARATRGILFLRTRSGVLRDYFDCSRPRRTQHLVPWRMQKGDGGTSPPIFCKTKRTIRLQVGLRSEAGGGGVRYSTKTTTPDVVGRARLATSPFSTSNAARGGGYADP